MKSSNLLYFATAAATFAFLLHAGSSLLGALGPTADVIADRETAEVLIKIADFTPGDVRFLRVNEIPFYVWRRNTDDISLAKRQDDPGDWPNATSIKTDGSEVTPAYDKDLTINHEWLFVVAVNPDGLGCIVKSRMGNFGGFFDPCSTTHFDLAGRVRKGPDAINLLVIPSELTEDGRYFRLDRSFLSGLSDKKNG